MVTTTQTKPTSSSSVYPSKSDIDSLNSIIAYLQLAKTTANSERYSHNLRQAMRLIQNLWKAENL